MRIIPYRPWHLQLVPLQPAQEAWRRQLVKGSYAEALDVPGLAWTATADDRVAGCAGLAPRWEGNVTAWALFGTNIPVWGWTAILRKIEHEFKAALASHGKHRVEATVPTNFAAGCRLMRLLRFQVEGQMEFYGPDGADHFLFKRIVEPCA